MRNIIQYPITTQEILATLERMYEEKIQEYERDCVCGDMDASVLRETIGRIKHLENLTSGSDLASKTE
jgi:hypothetical protein